jgi:hypothetical protein
MAEGRRRPAADQPDACAVSHHDEMCRQPAVFGIRFTSGRRDAPDAGCNAKQRRSVAGRRANTLGLRGRLSDCQSRNDGRGV